jgi:hypothetical protein
VKEVASNKNQTIILSGANRGLGESILDGIAVNLVDISVIST